MYERLSFLLIFALILSIPIISAIAEVQTNSSSEGTLDAKIEFDNLQPNTETKMKVEFIDPLTKKTQEHVDYTVEITNDGNSIFGPIPLTHTSTGTVSIPVNLKTGINKIVIDIEGILFMPIPPETIDFEVSLGISQNTEPDKVPEWVKNNAGWWADDLIDDSTFVSGIQFLIKEKIITVSNQSSGTQSNDIPKWVKNNAGWWAQDLISNDDFLKGIGFLIQNGIITIPVSN